MIVGDYLSPAGSGRVPTNIADVVYDYTFFCAMQIEDRQALAEAHARVLKKDGLLVTLQFPMADPDDKSVDWKKGPPFPLTTKIYTEHMEKAGLVCVLDEEVEASKSHPGRGGKERIAVWRRA